MTQQPDHTPVNPSQGLESLRASDFDTYSAIAELIDNSIQAQASKVSIELVADPRRDTKIKEAIFVDNGQGMDLDTLRICLGLGDGTRINDRKGIGRFGVGMTLGAIHECRKVEVYSKQNSSAWHYTYLDLDRIQEGLGIPYPVEARPPIAKPDIPERSGTIIIWSKYDTPHDSLHTKLIPNAKREFGRMFRKFIWGQVPEYQKLQITINGELVRAVDPLYVTKELTGFETEPQASELPQNSFMIEIPEGSPGHGQKSEVVIRMSLLPEEYTRGRGAGGDQFAKDRHINHNEGISILRNEREIFFGHIPHADLHVASREIQRYVGIEIQFSAEIDALFQVRNIKRGAVPVPELRRELVTRIKQPLGSQIKKIQQRWDKIKIAAENEAAQNAANTGVTTKHAKTQALIKKVKDEVLRTQKHKTDSSITPELILPEGSSEQKKALKELLALNGITINAAPLAGSTFIDIDHGADGKLLQYNTRSDFYTKYDSILTSIGDKDESSEGSTRTLIDLIFCAYLLAEGTMDFSLETKQEYTLDKLKNEWSRQLAQILSKWD
jgi:hypothetical protein